MEEGIINKDEEEQKEASLPHQLRNFIKEMQKLEEENKNEASGKG